MNKRISRFAVVLLTLLMLMGSGVRPASAQETADLALTKTADQKKIKIGENITFTITVTNLGPGTATGIVFGDPVPDPLNLVSFSCSQGTVSGQTFCAVDSLASGESVTATLVATPITNPAQSERKFTNTAFISESTTIDPNSSNDSDSLNLRIVGNIH
jgi:large repetitive protein